MTSELARPESRVPSLPISAPLLAIASAERAAAIETVERLVPADARVSVYLFQPVSADGLRSVSPGVLWDVGPLPSSVAETPRELLYQCAEAGRTGSFLQSAAECTRRVPQTTCINAEASRSYRSYNGVAEVRRAQIAVEQARHGFKSRTADGPPQGAFIHHLALAPSVQSFASLATGRVPVLGTIFTVTAHEAPRDVHEYSNLVDYAIFIASELLEVRAEQLLGRGHVSTAFEGSALESLLDAPTSDGAVQLLIKLLFAHHWFFSYDPAAHALLSTIIGDADATAALYHRHGWLPPRTQPAEPEPVDRLRRRVAADLTTLVSHICWYRLGREFRPRPGALSDAVATALNTALLLLCGKAASMPGFGAARRGAHHVFLGPSASLALQGPRDALLAPVFSATGIQHLGRQALDRFDASFAVCGPGDTDGGTRTHLKPAHFVEGFGPGGVPRFSARMQDGMRDRTRWLCSYAIGRLAAESPGERGQ